MKLGNEVEIEIRKTWYNKTQVQEDGITHIVDTEHKYPVYQFGMAKNYFDIEERPEVIRHIITDLKSRQLEDLLSKENEREDR